MTLLLGVRLVAYAIGGYVFTKGALIGLNTEGPLDSKTSVYLFMGTVLLLAAFS